MPETLEQIRDTLIRIEDKIDGLPNAMRFAATQVVVINGLSDIDTNLGLILAGEFRSGNQKAPGQGLTSARVRLRMRSVRMATCTWAEPTSLPCNW
jgi:hypothetical protein